MRKLLTALMVTCLIICPIVFAYAESLDLSGYNDAELLILLSRVQGEVVTRHIEMTANLTAGTYIGGRNIPVGSYILSTNGTENEHGIISLRSVNDPLDDYPSKLYKHNRGNDIYSVFVNIEEGDTLILPFPYTLTISGGLVFQ